ncbi:histidine kinase N-terminal 7TM domain-containing protein [Salinigranum halophilum]|uniref:histidine kinase N-terminal 7TM domain-containing protein n=1 Tax=Salinigranum halophilum TaxID=2565931 RepID=UPI0010A8314C|nr:histidine kinase N-terminal 7TM domain-containing protein [Salinigranum halophilum]
MALFGLPVMFLGYVLAFATATVVCGAALFRARQVEDDATRRGLVALFVGSGGWAAWELGFLVAPTPDLKYASYLVSLVIGLTTVGAWLYFCSAYTGRSFHTDRTYRLGAVVVYLVIVVVKVTNPLHGYYFTTAYVAEPFPHLTVMHGTFHWVITGLSYALVAVGFFMLYELFLEADYDTHALGAVAALTGLPVLFDIVGFATPAVIDMNYEPLGVAVFAVGVLFVFEEQFLAVQLTDGVDDPVVYLDDKGRIRQFNDQARLLFPALSGAVGSTLPAVLPDVADRLSSEVRVIDRTYEGERRHYLVSDTSFTMGQTDIGRIVVFTDVTRTERQRRELDRQNEQLEGFAAAIRHELLNTLQIVNGRVTIAGEALEDGDVQTARDSLRTASQTADRMSDIVDDLARLARQGQTLEATGCVDVDAAAREAWNGLETDGISLSLRAEGSIDADAGRTHGLFESAFAFARHNGASVVSVTLRDDGFVITDDGDPVGTANPEDFFAYGVSVPDAAAGMLLPNLRTLARTHGWEATIDTAYTEGVRLVVSGVDVRLPTDEVGSEGQAA